MSPTTPGLEIVRGRTWRGRLLRPARWVQLRLLAPMLDRFVAANSELWGGYSELSRRLDEVDRRIDRLTEEIAAANALAWDQVALSRRLAILEDLLPIDSRGPADPPSAA